MRNDWGIHQQCASHTGGSCFLESRAEIEVELCAAVQYITSVSNFGLASFKLNLLYWD
jgi:hypothetical protein